jgi:hypothetical protein
MQTLTGTLFIIAKTWKQPRYPSVNGQINQYIQAMEHFSVLKRKESLSHKKDGGNLNVFYLVEGVNLKKLYPT